MYSSVLSQLKTKDDAQELLNIIEQLKKALYEKGSFDKALEKTVRENISKSIKEDLSTANVSFEDYLIGLAKEIEKMEVITLVLAFPPTAETIIKIHNWLVANQKVRYLVDFKLDKSIIAGAVIIYQGKYHDFSLKKLIAGSFQTGRSDYWQILNSKK